MGMIKIYEHFLFHLRHRTMTQWQTRTPLMQLSDQLTNLLDGSDVIDNVVVIAEASVGKHQSQEHRKNDFPHFGFGLCCFCSGGLMGIGLVWDGSSLKFSSHHAHSLFLSFNLSLSIPFSLVVFQILFFVPNLQLSEDLGIRFYKQRRRRREKESSYLTQKFLSDVSSSTRFDLDFAVCEFLGERFHLRI